MELYIIKSAACLAILLLFYKLFLEKESFHRFKRFYLLAILIVSFTIPLITFIDYVEPEYVLGTFQNPMDEAIFNAEMQETNSAMYQPFNWSLFLWTVYGVGVLFFSIRFLLNLSRIVKRIKDNPKTKRQNFINVLLNDFVIPHTFFNYIFLNKTKFEKHQIPEAVLLHEQTHARQKHSIDILCIEILRVVFWFNPLIYLIKKDIKLNHEFLADQAVMDHGTNPTTYQQLLLAFSSGASEPLPIDIGMANAINYSSIKKRFTVMKTKTSQKTTWLKSLVLLPLFAFMVYGFSTTKKIEKTIEPVITTDSATNYTARNIDLKILNNGNYSLDGIIATKNTLASTVNTLHQDISTEVRNKIMNIYVTGSKEVSREEVWFIYNTLFDYGFYRIVTPNQEVVRGKGNTPFKMMAEESNDTPEISAQKSATSEQMAEYNKLAKHYNDMLKKKDFTIKMKHVERLKYIYGIMSVKQRQEAEPFPEFPTPPPPPPAPGMAEIETPLKMPPPPPPPLSQNDVKTGYKEINGQIHYVVVSKSKTRYFSRWGLEVDEKGNELNNGKQTKSSDVIPGQYVSKVYKNGKVMAEFDITGAPPPPPPPPAPPTMRELAEKGAVFYLEGNRISSKKAIEIVNKNKNINIQILDVDSNQPTVKLSKKAVTVKRSKAKQQADVNLKTGNIKINGKNYFYATKNGVTSYFNNQGRASDKYGKKLSSQSKKTPKFYYRGKQILSPTANKLLSRNTSSIALSTIDNLDGSYKIVLTDNKSKVAKNYNNANFNNTNPNSSNNNLNLNNNYDNPNSVIDLTEVISKGATFFYENEKITTEKALFLARTNSIERVQTIHEKDGKPKVYFWKKA